MATVAPPSAGTSSSSLQNNIRAHIQHQDRQARQQMGSTSRSTANPTPPASRQPSSRPNGVASTLSSASQASESSTSSAQPSFQPITLKQVMAAHGNDTHQALTGLLSNFNVALQDRESDKLEKARLNNENLRLWNWSTDLKKERDASVKEIRALCTRVVELEKILTNEGISIPIPPSPIVGASRSLLPPGETRTINGEGDHVTTRRPQAGPRSASDSASQLRDRQMSNRSDYERERTGTVALSASQSMNSFTTASSMESLPSHTSSSRDKERKTRAGASTPPVGFSSKSLTPQSHNSPFMGGASPGRNREQSSNSLPPLSSSAIFSHTSHQDSSTSVSSSRASPSLSAGSHPGMIGLATIPSTPVANNPDRTKIHEGSHTSSPIKDHFHLSSHTYTHGRLGERARSDTGSSSVDHLRIAKSSPLPSSPALSSHSAGSSSLRQASYYTGDSSSQQPSPKSPRFHRDAYASPVGGTYYIEGPTQGSPRHPNFHPPSQPRPTHAPSPHPGALQHATIAPSMNNGNGGLRSLSRKASSLDLGHDSKSNALQVPSRSVTPPPNLGSPNASISPVQYAYAPKTPPVDFDSKFVDYNAATPGSSRAVNGTPMVDLPDEARQWILNNGNGLPSPANPPDHRVERDRTVQSLATQMGGLGISDAGLGHDAVARHRKLSNVMNNGSRNNEGRSSPASMGSTEYNAMDSSATAGVLQDAYEPSLADEPMDTATTGQPGRPSLRERSNSSEAMSTVRGYDAPNFPLAPATQYASQPLPFRQSSDQGAATPLQQGPRPANARPRDEYGTPQAGAAPNYGNTVNPNAATAKCVPLVPGLLGIVNTEVVNSTIKPVDRGREAVVFHVRVALSKALAAGDPRQALVASNAPTAWIVEKTWSDLQSLDQIVRNKNSRSALRKVPSLPEKHLFKDHAPARVDQRKFEVQTYLQGLCIEETLSERAEVCAFLTSNIVSNRAAPVGNPGYKAGYLTKKGRSFGGWTTRYYVLQGRLLEYYDTPGGQHLGHIDIKGANIGRQNSKPSSFGDDAIRHAFLIRAKDKTGEDVDHILCAESDEERDHWVNMLVCCLTGEYVPDTIASAPKDSQGGMSFKKPSQPANSSGRPPQPPDVDKLRQGQKKGSRDLEILKGPAQPISQLSQDSANQKLFGGPQYVDSGNTRQNSQDGSKDVKHRREMSTSQSSTASGTDDTSSLHRGPRPQARGSTLPGSASMPANLDQAADSTSDSQSTVGGQGNSHRFAKPANASGQPEGSADSTARPKSPDKRMKISAPSGGMPIGANFKRKEDRRNKAKSSFWDFAGRRTGDRNATATPARPVFGVPIQEAVEIARVKDDSDLPAVVFRCVQYLSSVKAEQEEGIYRMSGSSAVIKALKERFNAEGDVDLTTEYFDPHAVAGLLKQFFRELPVHIFTPELNHEFIRANEMTDHRKKIKEVTRLVQQLPVANYSALRFLSAHLVNIIKAEYINKMGVKNMGIVFSPTLAIPATLFSLFINEFDRIFRELDDADDVELDQDPAQPDAITRSRSRSDSTGGRARRRSRNSTMFMQSGADKLLESMNDQEPVYYPAEDSTVDGQSAEARQEVGYRSSDKPAAGTAEEDTIRQQHHNHNKYKLTIDVTSAPSPAHPTGAGRNDHQYHHQPLKSPAVNSATAASSPRLLYPDGSLRSPGVASPISPRHASRAPS